jgi:diacylglycerol kinase (ATP)
VKESETRIECRYARHRLLRRIAGVMLLITGIGMCLACYTARTVFLTNLPPFLPPAGLELHPAATNFRMAAFGDFGAKVDSMEAVIRSIGSKADFTICTGDMMKFAREAEYGHVVSELREEMKCPFWAIPGNHDLGLLSSLETWHRFFGQDFYYWSYGDTLFIALNTAEGKLPEDQRMFLKQTLSSQRERYRRCVILCHIPPVDLRPKASHCLPAEEAEAFRKIISGYKIDLIISGHIHQYMEGIFAGIRLIHLPSSGQVIRDPDNRMFGYAMFDFKADGTIQVKQVDVTAETGRERLEFFASTVLGNKSSIFWAGLALIVIGSILLNQKNIATARIARTGFCPSPINPDELQPVLLHSGKKTGISHLWHATCYTGSGLKAVVGETAFRHELLAGCLLVPAAWLFPFPVWQALILCLLWAGVLVIEILNTAVEAVVDLVSPEYNPLAKKAKDLGSAAVGLCLAINGIAWVLAIWQLLVSR